MRWNGRERGQGRAAGRRGREGGRGRERKERKGGGREGARGGREGAILVNKAKNIE